MRSRLAELDFEMNEAFAAPSAVQDPIAPE